MLYCRGTSPVAAAKSRLLAYCFPSPISVEIVLAVSVSNAGNTQQALSNLIFVQLSFQLRFQIFNLLNKIVIMLL